MPEQTPPKTISWSKVILTVLVIVLVSGLASGVLFWYFVVRQPTESTPATTNVASPSAKKATSSAKTDETADWKVYTNTEAGFSIKFPPSYTKADVQSGAEFRSPDYKISNTPSPYLLAGGTISATGYTSTQTQTLESIRKNREESSGVINSVEKIKVNGVDALRFVWSPYEGLAGKQIIVSFIRGQKVYDVSVAAEDSAKTKLDKIFEQMLSTFKFL